MALAASMAVAVSAQGVKKMSVLADGSRELITTNCRYARSNGIGGGLFGSSRSIAMSLITKPDDSMTWCVVLPLTVKQRCEIAEGSRLKLRLQNGTSVALRCALGVKKNDNHEELDRSYTIAPRYAISEEQIAGLSQWEVESLSLETSAGIIDIDRRDYTHEWRFSTMIQRCHNVLKWKLDELNQL